MSNSMSKVMEFENEKILEYLPGSREREELKRL